MPNENITMATNNRTKAIQTGIILLTVDITKHMCSEKSSPIKPHSAMHTDLDGPIVSKKLLLLQNELQLNRKCLEFIV